MSSKSASRRIFFAFALLAALILASLPAQARTPAARHQAVTVPGDTVLSGIWRFVVSLWPRGTTKEGMSIDPNGNASHTGASTNPAGDLIDEGVTIDPNGSK